MKSYTISEINDVIKGIIVGETSERITAPEQLDLASTTEISFIGHKKYEKFWADSKASVAVVNEDIAIEPGENRAFIKVKNADLAMSMVLDLFELPPPIFEVNIHPSAIVDKTATIGNGTRIGPGSYIGPNVQLGENVTVYPNVTILDESKIGSNSTIWSGAVIRERCIVGNACIIHPNAVFDTGIWSEDILNKRAENYHLSVEEYKKNNLLKTEIKSKDVAELIAQMCGPSFSKTTGAQVSIDGGNDRVI